MAHSVDTKDAVEKLGSSVVVGNPDHWQLLSKFVSADKKIAKSTKAYELPGKNGCLVQVTTKEGDSIAEALTFAPGVKVADDVNGGKKLVSIVENQ